MFLEAHEDSQMDGVIWDTFKAYLRGTLKSTIAYIKKTNRREEEELAQACMQAEVDFIHKNYIIANSKRRLFFQRQKKYEHGDQIGKLIADLSEMLRTALVIPKIRDKNGEEVY